MSDATDAIRRDVQVYVRLSEQEHELIAAKAIADGMAPATWIRQQALRAAREESAR